MEQLAQESNNTNSVQVADNLMNTTILVCQNRTCKSAGSLKVLEAFEEYSNLGLKVIGCGCLGQCGNGPMVLILPQKIWYDRVSLSKVKSIIDRYLPTNKPHG